jgi:hypothetical protein
VNRISSFVLVVLSPLACAVSCKSTARLEERRIPVHVAIIPISGPTIGSVAAGEFEGEPTEMRLDLDCDEISAAVGAALGEYCFARATLLGPAPEEGSDRVDAFERERAWLEAARASGADWVLELSLRYDREVYRRITSTFWLNYPLFLFAGPSNWFIPDNAYLADVELSARIYDLHAIEAGGGGLGDPSAEVISVSSRFTGTELTFTERATGPLDYALAILVPSGHLARESRDTAQAVHEDIVSDLRVQIVQSLQSRRDDLVRMERIAPIYVVPETLRIDRLSDHLRVHGSIILRRNNLVSRVRAIHLEAGAERVTLHPLESDAGSTGSTDYPFDVSVPLGEDALYLRLECEAGTRDKFIRSYTFRIPSEARSPL